MALPSVHQTVNPSDTNPLDKGNFVGVDPVYQNHANKTDKPYAFSEDDGDDDGDDAPKDEVPASGQQSSTGTVPVPQASA